MRHLSSVAALYLSCFALFAAQDPADAPKIQLSWTQQTHSVAPNRHAASIAAFESTPVLAEGKLLVSTPFNQVLALDPGTGKEIWRFDPTVSPKLQYSEVASRGVAVAKGIVYFGTIDARLFALRLKDGSELWQKQVLTPQHSWGYQITSAPVVAGRFVIIGSSVPDNMRAEMEHGVVKAFDTASGELRWQWDATPETGKTGAANAWAPLSVDVKRDMVFVPTGSASPDFYGGMRPGNNLYANCVVALQASTGKLLWSFQVVHHDLWDYDVASRPALIEVRHQPAIGVLTKMGHYFALDRLTGKPLLPVEERSVPRSDIEGEAASPTQPFPASGVFTEQNFKPRPGWCEEQVKKLRYEGIFTPPAWEARSCFPETSEERTGAVGPTMRNAEFWSSPPTGWRRLCASSLEPPMMPPATVTPASAWEKSMANKRARPTEWPA